MTALPAIALPIALGARLLRIGRGAGRQQARTASARR
jgi:hypothetical protein